MKKGIQEKWSLIKFDQYLFYSVYSICSIVSLHQKTLTPSYISMFPVYLMMTILTLRCMKFKMFPTYMDNSLNKLFLLCLSLSKNPKMLLSRATSLLLNFARGASVDHLICPAGHLLTSTTAYVRQLQNPLATSKSTPTNQVLHMGLIRRAYM